MRLQVAVLSWERVDAVVWQRDGLRVLKLREHARRKDVLMMRCVDLARTQRLTRGRRPTGEKRDMCVFAGLRHAVVRLEPSAPAAQLCGVPGCERVAGRQEELRAEALQQGPP